MSDWVVLMPLKRLDDAKSRLAVPRTVHRRHVVRRMAEIVAATAGESPMVHAVVIVTTEDWDQRAAPVLVVREPPGLGLNAALSYAAGVIHDRWPDLPIVTLPADVAAMTAPELDGCLAAASEHRRAVVADHRGTGTVLLTAAASARLDPRFGGDSRHAHVCSGAVDLTEQVEAPLLRRDIDTTSDLVALRRRIGLPPGLHSALRRAGWDAVDHADDPVGIGPIPA